MYLEDENLLISENPIFKEDESQSRMNHLLVPHGSQANLHLNTKMPEEQQLNNRNITELLELNKAKNYNNLNQENIIYNKQFDKDNNNNKIKSEENLAQKQSLNTKPTDLICQSLSKEKKIYQYKINKTFIYNTTKDEMSLMHNMNSSIERAEPSLRAPDENLLQKIEFVNKEKDEEAKKIKEELEKIESGLDLDKRLLHEKWQIRKKAYQEISNLVLHLNEKRMETSNEIDLSDALDTFYHWLKYFITDNNVAALMEGLNTFYIYINHCTMEYKQKALIQFFDEFEKLIMQNKLTIHELCLKVILNAVSTKKFTNFTINEILRKLSTTNNKLLAFINRLIEEFLDNPGLINEHYLKLLFERVVTHYNSRTQSKQIERKKIYGKIISTIFEKINDDLYTLKHSLSLKNEDALNLDKLLSKLNKEKKDNFNNNNNIKLAYTLYEPVKEKEATQPHLGQNSCHAYKNSEQAINPENGSNQLMRYNNPTDAKNYASSNIITETVDLYSILPNEFFEIPYITALKSKREILENLNKKLADYISVKDREYKEVLNIVNYTIDDTNVLVNLEGIKLLKNICRLGRNTSNLSKIKNLLISCYEKFKDKKTNVKIELFDLFNVIILNSLFSFEHFFTFKLQHVVAQKNPIVKQNILEYIKETFSKSEMYSSSPKTENEDAVSRKTRNKSRDFRINTNQGK